MYDVIELSQWPRKAHFDFFKDFDLPFFNIVGDVDVTDLYHFAKDTNRSFFMSYLYYSLKVVNKIPEFRQRVQNDQVVQFHTINGSSTALKEDDTFQYSYFDYWEDIDEFQKHAQANISEQIKQEGLLVSDRLDMVYYSIIPWVSFTSFQHARSTVHKDTIPRIVFGKTKTSHSKILMPVSVEVNHALVDGLHVGKFFDLFSTEISNL